MNKKLVSQLQKAFEQKLDLDEREIDDYKLEEMYDDYLDEACGPVKICEYEYSTSETLKSVDPIAYRCGFSDFISYEIDNGTIEEINGKYYLVD